MSVCWIRTWFHWSKNGGGALSPLTDPSLNRGLPHSGLSVDVLPVVSECFGRWPWHGDSIPRQVDGRLNQGGPTDVRVAEPELSLVIPTNLEEHTSLFHQKYFVFYLNVSTRFPGFAKMRFHFFILCPYKVWLIIWSRDSVYWWPLDFSGSSQAFICLFDPLKICKCD